MPLLAGAVFTWSFVYIVLALYFILIAIRQFAESHEYALFAGGCFAVSGYAFCNAFHIYSTDPIEAAEWGRRILLFGPMSVAFVFHAITLYCEVRHSLWRKLIALCYIGSISFTLLNTLGLLHIRGQLEVRHLSMFSLSYDDFAWTLRTSMVALHAFAIFFIGLIVALVLCAYRKRKHEALFACIGGIIVMVCVCCDILVMYRVSNNFLLAEHAYSIFAFGLAYMLLTKHVRINREHLLKEATLVKKTQELAKAYEDLRAAQRELIHKEQLALIGELAAVVSHEVRNPLAIIGNAVAALRHPELGTTDRATLLSILDEEIHRMNRLIGDLLRYAKPIHIEWQKVDLKPLLTRACELSQKYLSIQLKFELAQELNPEVLGDPHLLRQVFDNLVQNACQAMTDGGVLSVHVYNVQEEQKEGVHVEIRDTGEGMNTLVRSRAGVPFFTTRPDGTGLGLALCERIIKAHNGTLSIQSRLGEGTQVTIFLPIGSDLQNDSITIFINQASDP